MFSNTTFFASFAVKDTEQAREFYGKTLGLKVTDEIMGCLVLHSQDGGRVFVYPKPDHTPATHTLLNFKVKDIDAAVDDLIEAGVEMEHYDMEYIKTNEKGIAHIPNGPAQAWFKDPFGNILSVLVPNKDAK